MRTCPVCNETFADDLKFCDLDGTPLKRDASSESDSSRLWSLLGIALLVGALVISAAMIIFQPRARVVQSPRTQAGESSAQGSNASGGSEPGRTGITDSSDVATGSPAPALETGAPRKSTASNPIPDGPAPDPKAAAIAAESPDKVTADPKPPEGVTITIEPPRPLKTAGEPPAADSATTARETSATAPTADPKKDPKPRATRESANKDSVKTDDKKKGGFLKVFKKIFGKQ